MIRPGLCSVTLRALGPDEVIRLAVAAELEAIEWGADVHLPPGDLASATALGRRCRDAGIDCASYGSYLFAGRLAPGGVVAVLDSAVALGAPNVRVWTDWVGPEPEAAVRGRIVDELREITSEAVQHRLTVSLEFHPGTLTETAGSTLALLDEVGAPDLFTYWQPPTGLSVDGLLASWQAVRHRVSHLHVFRWHSHEERLPLAEGEDLWPTLLDDVSPTAWPFDRVAFLEFVRNDDPAQVAADARVLRGWLRRTSR